MPELVPDLDRYGPHGAILRHDLALECGEYAVRVALRDGLLAQPWRGVVLPREKAMQLEARASAALLAVGYSAALTGRTAAAIHGCGAAAGYADIQVVVPHSCRARRRPGLMVYHREIADSDVVIRSELRVVTLELALAELLCLEDRRLALACLDQALADLPEDDQARLIDDVSERLCERDDPRGTSRALALLGLATGKAESPPESWLMLLVADAGFPLPEAQFEVRDLEGRSVYRLDLAWPEPRVALEYDGYEAHEDRTEEDAERDRRLAGRGWLVIRARARDLRDPARLLGELRSAFAARRRAALTTGYRLLGYRYRLFTYPDRLLG